jgi:hypothetical protein
MPLRVTDCDRCAALCCTLLGFEASPAFALAKPEGVPCPHLCGARCCGIHASLAANGFAGCAAYDCHGAGPHATARFAAAPLAERERHELFAVLRELHELLWILDGAARFLDVADLIASLERAGRSTTHELLALDLAPYRAAVRTRLAPLARKHD